MKFAAYAMPSFNESFGLTQGDFLRKTLDQLVSAGRVGTTRFGSTSTTFTNTVVSCHHSPRCWPRLPSEPREFVSEHL